jgi:hypothetical protein
MTINPSGVVLRGRADIVNRILCTIDGQLTRAEIQAEDPALPYDRKLQFTRKKFLHRPGNGATPQPMDPDARFKKEKRK